MSSKWFRFIAGSIFGIAISLGTLLIGQLVVPKSVPVETASSFFFAASAVNAALLVAIAVTILMLLRKYTGKIRRAIMLLSIVQLTVVFIRMVVAGLGILTFNPAVPFDTSLFGTMLNLVLGSWVISFVLLVAEIWATFFEE